MESGELASLICREVGKPIAEARGEVARSAAILRFHAAAALDPEGASYPPADGRSLLFTRQVPRGVVGLITPWNFPLAIPLWKLAPALAYGNVCVMKPSEHSPVSADRIAGLFEGLLPEGVLQVLHGDGELGSALVGNELVRRAQLHRLGAHRPHRRRAAGRPRRRRPVRDGRPERLDRAGRRRPVGGRRRSSPAPPWATPARSAPPPAA